MKRFVKVAVSMAMAATIAISPVSVLAGAGGGGGEIPPPAPPRYEGVPDVSVPDGYVAFYDFRGDVVIVRQNPTSVAVFDDGILALMMGAGLDVLGIDTIAFAQRDLNNLGWRTFGSEPITLVPAGTLFMHDVVPLVYAQPQLFMTGARSFGMCRYYTGVAQPRFNADNPDFGFGTRAEQEQALWDALPSDMAVAHMTINMSPASLRNDMRVNIDILSRIFPDAASELLSQFASIESQLDYIRNFVQGEDLSAVIFRVTGTAHMGSAFGYNTRWSFLYDEFGFNAAFPAGWPYTPAEMGDLLEASEFESLFELQASLLLEANPDVIFFVDSTEGVTGYGDAWAQLMANPHIQQLDAYRNGFIIGGLPNTEWYTTVGGFPSIQRMIDDVMRFVEAYRS